MMTRTIQMLIFLLPFTLCNMTLAQGNHSNEMKPEIVNVLVKAFEHSSTDVVNASVHLQDSKYQ
jgi:hypothetical protein